MTDARDGADTRGVANGTTSVRIGGHAVRGVGLDAETRCAHYAGERDVVAIRFSCCDAYYPCFRCHDALTDHDPEPLPAAEFDDPGVLCGACGTAMTVRSYLDCSHECPACGVAFNPGCAAHHDRYFEVDRGTRDTSSTLLETAGSEDGRGADDGHAE